MAKRFRLKTISTGGEEPLFDEITLRENDTLVLKVGEICQ